MQAKTESDARIIGLLEQLRERERDWYPCPSPLVSDNDTLSHYTSLGALFNIIDDCKNGFRFFRTDTMEDPQEGSLAGVDDHIAQALTKLDTTSWCRARYGSPAVISFVCGPESDRLQDRLLYWRLYGARAAGASIKIPKELVSRWVSSGWVQRVEYLPRHSGQPDVSSEEVLSFIERVDTLAADVRDSDHPASERWHEFVHALDAMMRRRFLRKAEDYAFEREARVLRWYGSTSPVPSYSRTGVMAEGATTKEYWEADEFCSIKWLVSGAQITLGPSVPLAHEIRRVASERIDTLLGPNRGGVSVVKSARSFQARLNGV